MSLFVAFSHWLCLSALQFFLSFAGQDPYNVSLKKLTSCLLRKFKSMFSLPDFKITLYFSTPSLSRLHDYGQNDYHDYLVVSDIYIFFVCLSFNLVFIQTANLDVTAVIGTQSRIQGALDLRLFCILSTTHAFSVSLDHKLKFDELSSLTLLSFSIFLVFEPLTCLSWTQLKGFKQWGTSFLYLFIYWADMK